MAIEGHPGVASDLLDALQDFAGQDFAHVALAQLGALRVVMLVQLKRQTLMPKRPWLST